MGTTIQDGSTREKKRWSHASLSSNKIKIKEILNQEKH